MFERFICCRQWESVLDLIAKSPRVPLRVANVWCCHSLTFTFDRRAMEQFVEHGLWNVLLHKHTDEEIFEFGSLLLICQFLCNESADSYL
ncbi:hypothetical protein Plhal304r1_c005g0019721 [Plasmopara halstedii]